MVEKDINQSEDISNERVYCYYCHNKISLRNDKLKFECISPQCGNVYEYDEVIRQIGAEKKTGSTLIEALLNAKCEQDQRPLVARCYSCGRSLYISFSKYGSPIIAIVGGGRAGKTCYIGALREKLVKLKGLRVDISSAKGADYIENIYQKLFWEKTLPEQDTIDRVEDLIPCGFGIGRDDREGRESGKTIITYNVSGEAFIPPINHIDEFEFISSLEKKARFIGGDMLSGIIMIIDPYQCVSIHQNMDLPGQPRGIADRERENRRSYDPENIISIITTYIEMNSPAEKNQEKIPINLALVLGKLDIFLKDNIDSRISDATKRYIDCTSNIPQILGEKLLIQSSTVEIECKKAHEAALELFKILNIQHLYQQASQKFDKVNCFAVSSLGYPPKEDSMTLEEKPEPIGVEIPFLWLFQNAFDKKYR